MLLSIKHMCSYSIEATDGHIGTIDSFLFDDETWTIRYAAVDTGKWLPGRKVLIAPESFGHPATVDKLFPVNLTRDQIKHSPDVDTDKPVSRQKEALLREHYQWPIYWGLGMTGGTAMTPYVPVNTELRRQTETLETPQTHGDEHLRSTREVIGYHINTADGEIGHIADFIAQDETWIIRYAVADTRNWLPGRKVLLPLDWIEEIRWAESDVKVDVSREAIEKSPKFDPEASVNRQYEIQLYDYYGRPKYWI